MSHQNVTETPPRLRLTRLILSLWAPQSIHAAAALRIPDLLADGPRRSDELAQAAGAHPGALYRLMRALVALELCAQTEDGAFALTQMGDYLRSDSPDSARSWALLMGGRYVDRKSTRLNSSHLGISYAVFCLKKKKKINVQVNIQKAIQYC